MRKRQSPKNDVARRVYVQSQSLGNPASSSRHEEPTEAVAELNPTVPKKQLATAIGFMVVVFLLCYWKTLVAMELQWRTEPDYSHGYLIIPLSVILLYSRRDSFPGYSSKFSWAGLILICVAGTLRLISSLSYMDFLESTPMGTACHSFSLSPRASSVSRRDVTQLETAIGGNTAERRSFAHNGIARDRRREHDLDWRSTDVDRGSVFRAAHFCKYGRFCVLLGIDHSSRLDRSNRGTGCCTTHGDRCKYYPCRRDLLLILLLRPTNCENAS